MLLSGRLLVRNSALSFAGQVGPLVVAVLAVPVIVHSLGVERFGILTLAWTAIGYFSLFDLGLGRALTQSLGAAIGGGRTQELSSLTRGALAAMVALGLVGAAVFAAITPWVVGHALNIPAELRAETTRSFYLLCVSLPFVLATAGLRSVFEAHQEFGIATALRVPYAIFNFLAPVAVLPFSHSLVPIVAILVAGRIAICIAHWIVGRRVFPFLRHPAELKRDVLVPLFKTGGWMTVSNVISPIMVNFDRFAVSGLLSVTAVAYYATPYDMVMKLLLVPGALLGVLFPAFAVSFEQDRTATARLLDRTLRVMLLAIFPPVLLLVAFGSEGMNLWLGREFATHSASVVRWLAAGVLINSMGQVAFAAVQSAGRADLTAKLHVVELPIYALTLVLLARAFGIAGVAAAWTIRVAIDTSVLLAMTVRRIPETRSAMWRSARFALGLTVLLLVAALIVPLSARIAFAGITLVVFTGVAWSRLLPANERAALLRQSAATP